MMSRLAKLVGRVAGLRQILGDSRRKPVRRLVQEAVELARRDGEFPWHYFITFSYREDAGIHTEYLRTSQYRSLANRLRSSEQHSLLEDKLRFHEWFRNRGFAVPRLLAHNEGARFWVGGSERKVDDLNEFTGLIQELRSSSSNGSIFVKPVDGWKGEECGRIDASDTDFSALYEKTRSRRFLFQETLTQHPALNAIFPRSINTIRVLTCHPRGEPPTVVAAVLRLGAGQSIVDNASRGGIFVGVDLATGRLLAQAHKFFEHGGNIYTMHPDTGFRFEGFALPCFQNVLAQAHRAASELSHEVVGWDLVITENDVLLLEGNPVPHLPLMEVGMGRGLLANPSFRKLYEGMGLPI